MSLAPIPIEPAEIVESRLEVQDLPKDVPSDEYTSSVEHERDSRDDTSVKIAEEAARMDQTEADGADSSGKQTAVGNKKGRKEKKPQPPSLFDF